MCLRKKCVRQVVFQTYVKDGGHIIYLPYIFCPSSCEMFIMQIIVEILFSKTGSLFLLKTVFVDDVDHEFSLPLQFSSSSGQLSQFTANMVEITSTQSSNKYIRGCHMSSKMVNLRLDPKFGNRVAVRNYLATLYNNVIIPVIAACLHFTHTCNMEITCMTASVN